MCTNHMLDLWLKPHLESVGHWEGRGFATILFEDRFDKAVPPNLRNVALLHFLLHEIAHWFTDPASEVRTKEPNEWKNAEPALSNGALVARVKQEIADERAGDDSEDTSRPPWHMHDGPFIRSVLHIVARANRNGFETCPARMSAVGYGLDNYVNYLDALNGETQERIDEPLHVVLADDPPASYRDFAKQDLVKSASVTEAGRVN